MPGARTSSFKGGGFLRDVDGTIVEIQFSDVNGSFEGQPRQEPKEGAFRSFWANVSIQVDGSDKVTKQGLFAGSADDFGVTEDGRGATGTVQFGKTSGWALFYNTLVESGFDESTIDDSDPEVADYTPIIGARCRFNQQTNEKLTKKLGQRVDKKDPKKKYDRTDLIVTNYYGQVEVKPVAKAAAGRAKVNGKVAKPNGKIATTPNVDIAALAAEQIAIALASAKGNVMSKAKFQVKVLSLMGTQPEDVRTSVREWATVDTNLLSIEGVDFDVDTKMLSLSE